MLNIRHDGHYELMCAPCAKDVIEESLPVRAKPDEFPMFDLRGIQTRRWASTGIENLTKINEGQ